MTAPASFWRTDDPVLNEQGRVVKGGMWPYQREWWGLPNFIRMLVGGYGSGKTMVLCKRMIALALLNAPAPSAIVSPTFHLARDTTIETTCELLDGKRTLLQDERFGWELNKTSHAFTIRHRDRVGRLVVYSGENPQRLKGPNLGAVGIDEPFIQDQAVFEQMIARVRHPKAKRREINLTGTPEQLNWGYELAEGDMREQHDVGVVRAPTRGNLALDAGYAQRLMASLDPKAQAAYMEGAFVNLSSGLVYYGFDPARNILDERADDSVEWGCGMDFNVNPMAFCVFWRSRGRMHVVEEFELPNSDTEDAAAVLTERYAAKGLHEIYPDPSGKNRSTKAPGGISDFHILRDAGFEVNAPNAPWKRRDRYNAVNKLLREERLTIAPRCKRLRRYLSTYSHELMNKQEEMSHLLDALGYAVIYLHPPVARMRTGTTVGMY